MRNQRWVECKGSSLSFGDCCLITNSTRSEVGAFSDGIRTIFQVATPTKDSQPNTIIIGHMEGEQGYCTNDSPMYAKCDQQAIPGDEVGPVAGSRTLMKGQRGYLVMGDVQGGMARVRRMDSVPSGRIGFKMTGPRLRLRQSDGTRYGTATAIVEWIVGDVPVSLGDQVTVNFGGIRWAEAVKNCEGEADYFPSYSTPEGIVTEDIYVVTECQGLPLRIAFITLEDRNPFSPDQDVRAVPLYAYGAAQDDLPIADWYQVNQGSGEFNCGTLRWTWIPNANLPQGGQWQIALAPGSVTPNQCCIPDATEPPIPQDPTVIGYYVDRPFGVPGPACDPPTQQPAFFVRYPQLTFPRALEGADGHAILDNAAWSDDPADMRYVVVESNQAALILTTTLSAKMCGSAPGNTDGVVKTPWPFSQKPKNISYTNPKGHYGKAGDPISGFWDDVAKKYEVFDVKLHKVKVPINFVFNAGAQGGCPSFSWEEQEMAIERCEDPIPKSAGFESVSVVTGATLAQQGCDINLNVTRQNVCAFPGAAGQPSTSKITFTKKSVLERASGFGGGGSGSGQDCSAPSIKFAQAYVLSLTGCDGDAGEQEVVLPSVQITVMTGMDASGCPVWSTQSVLVLGLCGDAGGGSFDCGPFECPGGSGSGSGQ
jgi:hypothetical protein